MIPEDVQGQEQAGGARGLGPLFSGLIAATLIALTLLVAVALGMGEQQMTARVEPTVTEREAPPTAALPASAPRLSVSPSPTFTAMPPPLAASATPSPTLTPSATASTTRTPRPSRTPRPTRVYPTATRCVVNPWGWDYKWIVRTGDTLYSIARATGTTLPDLKRANCLISDVIYKGQPLWVPRLPVTPTRTPSVPPPEIIAFTLDPASQVILGECVQVDWEIEGEVDRITLMAGAQTLVSDGEKTGSISDCPSALGSRLYRLTATGPGGTDSASRSITVVEELEPPVAAFAASPTSGEAPLAVSFTDQSTGEIDSWSWSFGDGGSSSAENPSHTYSNAGDYTVTLTVTGPGGSDSASTTIHITAPAPAPPVAAFTASPTSGEAPLKVQFTDHSTGDIDSWSWTFGDGHTSSKQNPSHEYAAEGTYTATLVVTGPGGSDSASTTIQVKEPVPPPPVAAFAASPTSGEAPLAVSFTDQSTGEISSWSWSFGDGGSSSAENPSHTYSNAGDYTVTLTVTGPGGSDSASTTIHVTEPATEAAGAHGIILLSGIALVLTVTALPQLLI